MRFSTTLLHMGNNTGIEVPPDVLEGLGAGKRPAVVVVVTAHARSENDQSYEFRSTVASMGGKYLIPFSAERRKESGIGGGDPIDVELTADTAPRVVEVPEDLQTALDASPGAAAAWQKLAPSYQKAHVTSVLGAKAAETRARRVAAVVAKLGPGPSR